ncbi:MAG: sterol carrier family protein [Nocardioides sp.]
MARTLRPADPALVEECLGRRRAHALTAADQRVLVKHFLAVLAQRAPGNSVEIRVPPFAAVQAIAGVRHTRGTPPAVVELDADTWLELALGELSWAEAEATARLSASGERADLSPYLPV